MSSIKEEMTVLVALQQCEKQIGKLEHELARVEARIKMLNQQLEEFEKRVVNGQQTLAELKKQYRAGEADIKLAESQVSKSQEKLRAVKTNKEYTSTLKEIDDLKVKASQLEDGMLRILDKIESTEAEVAQAMIDLKDVKADVDAQRNDIRAESESQEKELAVAKQEREAILARLPAALVEKYNKVKVQGRGIAIAAVADSVCQVCRMNIPPQFYNELLRMDTFRMCPNCQRIVYPKVALEEG